MSSICSMRGMPSVRTDSTCVSPRWNRPVPCAVGMTPTSADSGRMSAVPRPSMRTPSLTMRRAHDFLLQRAERALDLARRAGELARARRRCRRARRAIAASISSRRVVALGLVGDRHRLGGRAPSACCVDRVEDVGRVVDRGRVRDRLDRAVRLLEPRARARVCRSIDAPIHCFDSSRPSAITSSVTFGAPSS